jgi:trans-aconitate methyltransferase
MASTAPLSTLSPAVDPARIARWRADWDAVMARFVPGLAGFEATLFAAAETVRRGAPGRVLDLGGGPGVLAERMAQRWPRAEVGLLDLDPVLLALAGAAVSETVTILEGDLSGPSWLAAARGHAPYDVVTVVMTMHYLPEAQARELYRGARAVLAPGGLLVVADLMPDAGISSVMTAMPSIVDEAAAELAWAGWWAGVTRTPALAPLVRERAALFAAREAAEFTPDAAWHLAAARAAGFTEAGVLWRCGRHAAVAAVA